MRCDFTCYLTSGPSCSHFITLSTTPLPRHANVDNGQQKCTEKKIILRHRFFNADLQTPLRPSSSFWWKLFLQTKRMSLNAMCLLYKLQEFWCQNGSKMCYKISLLTESEVKFSLLTNWQIKINKSL